MSRFIQFREYVIQYIEEVYSTKAPIDEERIAARFEELRPAIGEISLLSAAGQLAQELIEEMAPALDSDGRHRLEILSIYYGCKLDEVEAHVEADEKAEAAEAAAERLEAFTEAVMEAIEQTFIKTSIVDDEEIRARFLASGLAEGGDIEAAAEEFAAECVERALAEFDDSEQRLAVAKYGAAKFDEVEPVDDDGQRYSIGAAEYLVLTDDEAMEAAREYCRETLWAFNASFIVPWIPSYGAMTQEQCKELERSIREAQERLCEGANAMVAALLGDNVDAMIDDAIECDGRGHFLATYDGKEGEEGEYFIYRTN